MVSGFVSIVSGEKTDANHGTETEYIATAELNNKNYSIKTESKTHKFTIEPRDLTIQLKDQKIIKHQSLPQGKDTVDNSKTLGLVAADFVSDIQIQKSATGLQVEGVEGTAKIGRTNATETEDITYNYNITVLPGNLEEEKIVLKPENVTTPPTASDIIYGDSLDDSEITGGVVKDDDDREVKGTWTWKKVDGKEPNI